VECPFESTLLQERTEKTVCRITETPHPNQVELLLRSPGKVYLGVVLVGLEIKRLQEGHHLHQACHLRLLACHPLHLACYRRRRMSMLFATTEAIPRPRICLLPVRRELFASGSSAVKRITVVLTLCLFFTTAGYGQGTTEQQLRDLVGQFAQVTGVVSKGSFSFVNTTDRVDAVRAREMLGGSMFNGGVLRINFAKETGRLGTSFDLTYNTNTGPRARAAAGPPPAAMNYYGRG